MAGLGGKHIVNAFNLWCVVFVALGTLSTAYGLAIIGSTVGQPNFYTYFDLPPQGEPGYNHTSNIVGALNGVNSAGAVMGCLLSAWAADAYGRKRTIQIGCLILIVGGAICAGSVNIGMFLAGRVLAGIGSGVLAVVVPMYQGEISTAETRGAMMCVTGIFYAFGYTLAGWLGFACYFFPSDTPNATFAWRFPLAFQCLPPLVVLAGSNLIPYSPRWLLSKGKREEAFEIVKRLHRQAGDPEDIAARQEFYLMEKQYEMDAQYETRSFEIFRTRPNRYRSMVAAIMMWGDQFLGIFVITNYGVLIYASLGLSGAIPLLLNASSTTMTIIGNIWTALYIDRFGRRIFLLIGTTGCTVSLIFLCTLTAKYVGTTNSAGLNGAVFFIWFFIVFWCFFMDATQYVYVSEIWPNHLRSQGTAFGLAFFYLASEVTLVAAPPALDNIGWRFYLVLIVPSACYTVAIYFLFPETKGRTLEEIGTIFGDDRVASHWYGISEEEKSEIARNALMMTKSGSIPPMESSYPSQDAKDEGSDEKVEDVRSLA